MAHFHIVSDDDRYFTIDPYSKAISYEGEGALIIGQSDHNSERFTFELPRYIEGHDMMLCDQVQVHYINIASDNKSKRNVGIYKVLDLQIAEDDDEIVLCSWIISQNATLHIGSLNFVLRFACTSGSKIDYSWNTRVYSSVAIAESIDNAELVVDQYADILQEWYMELLMAGTMGVNVVADAQNTALDAIASADVSARSSIDSAKQDAIEEIKNIDVIVEVEAEVIERIENAGNETIEEIKKEIYTGETELVDSIPVYEGGTEVVT